jgi:hypothetical protein
VIRNDVAANQTPPAPGVISTIADGFSMALWRPFIVMIPVILDVYYWLGWKIELGALAVSLQRWLIDAGVARTDENILRVAKLSQWDAATTPSFFFVPSLLAGVNPNNYYDFRTKGTFSASTWGLDLLILAGLIVLGMYLSAAFMVMLADAALDRDQSFGRRLKMIQTVWVRLMGAIGLALLAAAAMFGPLAGAWAVSSAAGLDLGPLFGLLALLLGIGLFAMFWFAPEAIVMSDVGPVEAVKRSFAVVREFFWASLCFLAAFMIMSFGLGDLCLRMAGNAPGLLIGITANAFFSSGLAIASLLFYDSRIKRSRYATSKSGSAPSRASR